MQGVEFVKLVRYGSRDSLTIDLGMVESKGKKENDEDFLVQCSQRLPSESEATEVPTHDAVGFGRRRRGKREFQLRSRATAS